MPLDKLRRLPEGCAPGSAAADEPVPQGHSKSSNVEPGPSHKNKERHASSALAIAALLLLSGAAIAAETQPPYSCRLLYDEERKCSFGACDHRVVERLRQECLRDGGRP